MNLLPLVPYAAPTFSDSEELVCHSLSKLAVPSSVRRIDDPPDRVAASLTHRQRDWNLDSGTTASNTFLLSDFDQRSNRVHNGCKVENGIQRKLGSRQGSKETAFRVDLRRWCRAKLVEDKRHVLLEVSQILQMYNLRKTKHSLHTFWAILNFPSFMSSLVN